MTLDALYAAIVEAADDGRTVPCLAMRDEPGWISENDAERRDAAKLCTNCPVLKTCRNYIAQNPEPAGVWAGLTEIQRLTPQQRRRRKQE